MIKSARLPTASHLPAHPATRLAARLPTLTRLARWIWRTPAGCVALVFALTLVGRLPDLFFHFHDWDEAAMMSQAWAMTRGQVLYRDIFQIHPPLQFLYLLPAFSLFDPETAPHVIKGMNLFLSAAAALLLHAIAWRQTGDRAVAHVAAISFVGIVSVRNLWTQSTYGEFLAIVPVLASALLLFTGEPRRRSALAAGALWTTAVLCKQVALVDCVALAILFAAGGPGTAADRRRQLLRAVAGAALATLPVVAWLAASGALQPAVRQLAVIPLAHYLRTPGGSLSVGPLAELWRTLRWPTAAALLAIPLLWRRSDAVRARRLGFGALAWALVLLAAFCVGGGFTRHYLLQLVPPLALAAATLVAAVPARWRTLAASGAVVTLAARLAIPSLWLMVNLYAWDWRPAEVRRSQDAAEVVDRLSAPDEGLFLYGPWNLDIHYLSQRLSPNGIYMYIDMAEEHIRDRAHAAARQQALLDAPPKLILTLDSTFHWKPSLATYFTRLLGRSYRRVGRVGSLNVYQLRGETPPLAPGAPHSTR